MHEIMESCGTKEKKWACFYYEGAKVNEGFSSKWGDRYCHYYFQRIGLAQDEARLLCEPVRL